MKYFFENLQYNEDLNIPALIYENKDFQFLAHWHNDIEIACVKEGSIFVGVNNERRMLVTGDIVICSSGDIHYYEQTDEPSSLVLLVFKPEIIGYSSQWPISRRFLTPFITRDKAEHSNLRELYNILDIILKEKKDKKPYYEMAVKARIIDLCTILLRYFESSELGESKDKYESELQFMQNLMLYIEENYDKDITIKKIAQHFHVNHSNLSKKFNSLTGMNFKTYLNILRTAKAENMIINTKLPLMDIAYECGFNSIRNFNRVYKSLKGCIPSRSREKDNV